LKDLGHDQVGIWTSPLRIKPKDAFWLVPFAAATGVALHYDAQAQQQLGINKTRIDASNAISDVGLFGSIGGAGGLYLLGAATHNDHLAGTGRLGVEAIINSLLLVEALKLATNRERPDEGNGQGGFWPHGTRKYELDGSFPSGHAAVSWSLAEVVVSEYPNKPVQFGAYAFAIAISASRVTARRHFPSDVIVGGTFGYLIGRYVVRHHAAKDDPPVFSFAPVMETQSGTYGMHVEFEPSGANLSKVAWFIDRLYAAR
jgi:membrane-associated phospholipid phosphatase